MTSIWATGSCKAGVLFNLMWRCKSS